jgi:hypothetical protein
MPWKLVTGYGKQILNPDWSQIQQAILEMNGTRITEVILQLTEQGSLFVEGGDEGRYLVVYFPEDHPDTPSLTLSDLSLSGPDVRLTVQTPTEYAAKYAIKLPLVLHVLEQFFHTGKVPKDVRWEIDNTEKEADL